MKDWEMSPTILLWGWRAENRLSRELSSEVWGIEGKQLVTSLEEGSKEMDWNYMLCRKAVAYK